MSQLTERTVDKLLGPAGCLPAVAGIAGITASAVVADLWAIRTGRPTISALIGDQFGRDPHAALTFGVLASIGWHLVVHPIIRSLTP